MSEELQAAELNAETAEAKEAIAKEQREQERRAERARHPHMQLRGILKDLQAPAAISSDSATKHAHLHAAVVRITQLMLQHTPAPEEDDGQEQRQSEQHAQGHDEQVATGV